MALRQRFDPTADQAGERPPTAPSSGLNVTVCVASHNTRASVELCVRSLRETATYPMTLRVGDAGSSDGSLTLLEDMQSRGLLTLDRSSTPRLHAEWLDHWFKHVDADLLVFVDSDIEFRRSDWLLLLVDEAKKSGAALIYSEWSPRRRGHAGDRPARLAERPAPWLLGVSPRKLNGIRASFAEVWTETASVPEGILVHDVAAAFYGSVVARGAKCAALPRSFRRRYHHYGGLSWIPAEGPRGRKKRRDERVTARRLRLLRVAQESDAPFHRLVARARLTPAIEEVREYGFRASSKLASFGGFPR
jgi:hypothetical protein